MKLNYRELGNGSPVVIMHGVFGSSDNWLTVSKDLSQNHHIYLLDLRNHGQSPHSDEFSYKAMASDLQEFLMDHEIVKPVIIGHSMGGKVAMKFAADFNNLSKLIVVDIAPRYYPRHHDSILEGLNSLNLHALTTRQEADIALTKFEPSLGVRQFLLKNLYRNANNEFAWRLNLKVITEKIDIVGEALEEGVTITVPTLFIRGGESRYIQDKDIAQIRSVFSDVKIETIEGAGHWVQAEKPIEFARLVNTFLS